MPGFEKVIGLEEVVNYLQKIIKTDTTAQTYIFHGEEGTGKKLLAGIFAMTLQCEKGGIEPCLTCSSCKKAESGNHPDIITVHHEKPNLISVDEIRSQVVGDIMIRPECSKRKIYIIPDAEKMNESAQNAILKTLEDLPAYAMILLLTANADSLLPTIRSRCVHLQMRLVHEKKIVDYLQDTYDLSEYYAQVDAAYAQGNVGKAIAAAGSGDFHSRVDRVTDVLAASYHMSLEKVTESIRLLTEDKAKIEENLELATLWFRDVLLFKATYEVDKLVFRNRVGEIKERALVSSYEGIERILSSIEKARARLKANVNFELTMELLLLTIREN